MKKWIIKLLSDSKNLPSTRLHLAWFFAFIAAFYIFYCLYKGAEIRNDILTTLLLSISSMAGISIFEKGGKNETNNNNSTNGESQD